MLEDALFETNLNSSLIYFSTFKKCFSSEGAYEELPENKCSYCFTVLSVEPFKLTQEDPLTAVYVQKTVERSFCSLL